MAKRSEELRKQHEEVDRYYTNRTFRLLAEIGLAILEELEKNQSPYIIGYDPGAKDLSKLSNEESGSLKEEETKSNEDLGQALIHTDKTLIELKEETDAKGKKSSKSS